MATTFKKMDINTVSAQEIVDHCVMIGKEKAEAIVKIMVLSTIWMIYTKPQAFPGI